MFHPDLMRTVVNQRHRELVNEATKLRERRRARQPRGDCEARER
jgi:hypothetical protein